MAFKDDGLPADIVCQGATSFFSVVKPVPSIRERAFPAERRFK